MNNNNNNNNNYILILSVAFVLGIAAILWTLVWWFECLLPVDFSQLFFFIILIKLCEAVEIVALLHENYRQIALAQRNFIDSIQCVAEHLKSINATYIEKSKGEEHLIKCP